MNKKAFLLASLASLTMVAGQAPAFAASVTFDFNDLNSGINAGNSTSNHDSIDDYMTKLWKSPVNVLRGSQTMIGKPQDGLASGAWYLGNTDGATKNGSIAKTKSGAYLAPGHENWRDDTFLINRWNYNPPGAAKTGSAPYDRIIIEFSQKPITQISFDWEIFPSNGSGKADFTFKAFDKDGKQVGSSYYHSLDTTQQKEAGLLGHYVSTVFSKPVYRLEFIDWHTAPVGIDNVRASFASVPGLSPLVSVALAAGMMAGVLGWRRRQRVSVRPS